jgi:hypothetical protein
MRRRRPHSLVLAAAIAAWAALTGCTDRADGVGPAEGVGAVAPLTASTTPDHIAASSGSSVTSSTPPGSDPSTTSDADGLDVDGPTTDRGADGSAEDGRRRALSVTGELLDRYGRVLTALAADPAVDLGRFAASWSDVADPGSTFSRDMLRTLVARVRDDRMIVLPGPGGRSYLHRPVTITAIDDASIDFTWCGWSPGIGVHVETKAVLDDAVGHASGTGRLVRSGDRWLLDRLDQEQLVALPPGSPDPCTSGGATR